MKIGLALGGGGFKGTAHIGVLEQLNKFNIRPDMVAGTSVGAIVGLIFCEGGVELVSEFYDRLDREGIISRKNLLKQRSPDKVMSQIEAILRQIIETKDMAEFKTKLFITATDIKSGDLVVFDSGDPVSAAMASSAYPGVFAPVHYQEKYFCDGGVINNMPADILKNHGATFIIGSLLNTFSEIDCSSLIRTKVLRRAIEIMEIGSDKKRIALCDFLFSPPLSKYAWYNFEQSAEIAHIGRVYAERKINELAEILVEKKKIFNFAGFWKKN